MQANSLSPTILTPTRVASVLRNGNLITTKTLIDNIYLNTQNNFKSGTLEVSISDHYPVFTTLSEYKIPESKNETIIEYRLINDMILRKFKYALENNTALIELYHKKHSSVCIQCIFSNIQ